MTAKQDEVLALPICARGCGVASTGGRRRQEVLGERDLGRHRVGNNMRCVRGEKGFLTYYFSLDSSGDSSVSISSFLRLRSVGWGAPFRTSLVFSYVQTKAASSFFSPVQDPMIYLSC